MAGVLGGDAAAEVHQTPSGSNGFLAFGRSPESVRAGGWRVGRSRWRTAGCASGKALNEGAASTLVASTGASTGSEASGVGCASDGEVEALGFLAAASVVCTTDGGLVAGVGDVLPPRVAMTTAIAALPVITRPMATPTVVRRLVTCVDPARTPAAPESEVGALVFALVPVAWSAHYRAACELRSRCPDQRR